MIINKLETLTTSIRANGLLFILITFLIISTAFMFFIKKGTSPKQSFVSINQTFDLTKNHKAIFKDGDSEFEITFLKVIRDSRCPKQANCMKPGEAVIELEISKGDQKNIVRLVDSKVNASFDYEYKSLEEFFDLGYYRVIFLDLEPRPEKKFNDIFKTNYKAHFKIEKNMKVFLGGNAFYKDFLSLYATLLNKSNEDRFIRPTYECTPILKNEKGEPLKMVDVRIFEVPLPMSEDLEKYLKEGKKKVSARDLLFLKKGIAYQKDGVFKIDFGPSHSESLSAGKYQIEIMCSLRDKNDKELKLKSNPLKVILGEKFSIENNETHILKIINFSSEDNSNLPPFTFEYPVLTAFNTEYSSFLTNEIFPVEEERDQKGEIKSKTWYLIPDVSYGTVSQVTSKKDTKSFFKDEPKIIIRQEKVEDFEQKIEEGFHQNNYGTKHKEIENGYLFLVENSKVYFTLDRLLKESFPFEKFFLEIRASLKPIK